MKHLLSFLFIAALLQTPKANAQTTSNWRIGFGVDAGAATSDAFKYALSGDIRVQRDIGKHLSATITTGFSHFFEKDHFAGYNQYGSPYNVIPVKAGLKYFVAGNLYVGGEAGAGFAFEQWGTSFLWSPSIGIAFTNGIDISLKYEDYIKDKATKDIGLRLAYSFGAKKLSPHKKTAEPKGWQWGASLSQGLTTTAFEGYIFGIEGDLSKSLSSNIELTFSAGYAHSFRKAEYFNVSYPLYQSVSTEDNYTKRDIIPVKAGLRLYLGNQFYFAGEAGVAFASGGTKSFMYTPSMGVKFRNGIDVSIKYDKYSNFMIIDALSVKVGYHFK